MNYQHAFHAGNFADVHKHIVLARIVEHLRQKPAAFRIIDSHAGAGRYDLLGEAASRSGEWRRGIAPLYAALHAPPSGQAQPLPPVPALLAPYLDGIAAVNPGGGLRYYPGSPLFLRLWLRPQDRLVLSELEPRAATRLAALMREDRRVKVLKLDGWTAVKAGVPPKERRGLVLIDPPYEKTDEFACLPAALAEAHRKWPTGLYMLWYPIKDRLAPDVLAKTLRQLEIKKMLRCELTLGPPRADAGLTGSGIVVVNPPFKLEIELETIFCSVCPLISSAAAYRHDWLTGEEPT
jgi:23S rRNA (adenine2030-N6)-methyltransferase